MAVRMSLEWVSECSGMRTLDNIGRETAASESPSNSHDAMQRVQDQSDENQRQRETEAKEIERQKLERERKERDLDHGLDFGF